jgi:hypothetical protein
MSLAAFGIYDRVLMSAFGIYDLVLMAAFGIYVFYGSIWNLCVLWQNLEFMTVY